MGTEARGRILWKTVILNCNSLHTQWSSTRMPTNFRREREQDSGSFLPVGLLLTLDLSLENRVVWLLVKAAVISAKVRNMAFISCCPNLTECEQSSGSEFRRMSEPIGTSLPWEFDITYPSPPCKMKCLFIERYVLTINWLRSIKINIPSCHAVWMRVGILNIPLAWL